MMPETPFSRFNERDRGQILLLAAFAIVILVFGMITMLNTAAFTQQERVTGVNERGVDVVQHLESAEYSIETAIRHANHDPSLNTKNNPNDREHRLLGSDTTDGELQLIESQLTERLGSEGVQVIVDSSTAQTTNGTRIWQSGYNQLITTETDPGPTPPGNPPAELPQGTYGVVTGADNMRSFTIMVTGENVAPAGPNAFEVEMAGHQDVFVYNHPDADTITLSDTTTADGEQYNVTASPDNPARISFTHGTLNNKQVPILPGTEGIESVTVKNGDNISAAFDMVVTGEDSIGFVADNANKEVRGGPTDTANELQAHEAVYAVTVVVTVQTPEADIKTTIRVTPQLPGYAEEGAV